MQLHRDLRDLVVRPHLPKFDECLGVGEATANQERSYSTELIRAPIACIDYVLAHELAHIRYPHHGAQTIIIDQHKTV